MFMLNFADSSDQPSSKAADAKAGSSSTEASGASGAASDGQSHHEDEHHQDEVAHTLTLMLPWAISVLLHLGMGLLAVFAIWSVTQPEEEELVVPEARMVEEVPTEVLTFTEDVESEASTDVPQEVETQTVDKGDPMSDLNQEVETDQAVIGVSGSSAMPVGSPTGNEGLSAGVYGIQGGNARTLVYLVDASGSLADTLPFVLDELRSSIRKLVPEQRFTVIFFQRNEAIEVPRPHMGLKKATEETKRAVIDWIDPQANNIVPGGASNPEAALERGLQLRPDLMFIISDNITGQGQYAVDQHQLLSLIGQTKQRRGASTMINTIQFLYPDPLGTLKKIAQAHGGKYKFVGPQRLGLSR